MAKPVAVDDKSFDEVVLRAKTPVLVDFWAPWCPPCRAIAPLVEELADEYKGKVGFAKLNVDENPAVPSRYNIHSIPTLLVFKAGQAVEQIVGFKPKGELKRHLDKALAPSR